MTQLYLSKSITSSTNGITASVWVVSNFRIRNNVDPTKISFSINVVGYVDLSTFTNGLQPVQGIQYIYQFNSSNFPTGKDLTSVSLTDVYDAIVTYINTKTSDPLNGAVLTSV